MSDEKNGAEPVVDEQPAARGIVIMDIPECHLCAMPHERVELHPYGLRGGRTPTNATHWYTCPTMREPLAMTLAGPGVPLDGDLLASFGDALCSGRWLVLVAWEPTPGGKFRYFRKQDGWPKNRYGELLLHAAVDMHGDTYGAPAKQELPAGKLPTDLKLFQKIRSDE